MVLVDGVHAILMHDKELPKEGYFELEVSRVFRFMLVFIFGGFFQSFNYPQVCICIIYGLCLISAIHVDYSNTPKVREIYKKKFNSDLVIKYNANMHMFTELIVLIFLIQGKFINMPLIMQNFK